MREFVRATKLPDIGGRGGYIVDPKRQEKVLAKSAPVDWEPYHQFELAKQKTLVDQTYKDALGRRVSCESKSIEGREIMVTFPNSWAKLREAELAKRADHLARLVVGEGKEFQWAVHWNKTYTDLHMHVIFSERERLKEPERWDRDIYLTDDGKVARRKADRAKDENGKERSPIHKKGDLKGEFGPKDTTYKEKNWLYNKKIQLKAEMQQRWRVKFEEPNLLPEFHEGKGKEAPQIRKKNEAIRAMNKEWAEYTAANPKLNEYVKAEYVREAKSARRRGAVALFGYSDVLGTYVYVTTLDKWKERETIKEKAPEKPSEEAQKADAAPQSIFERAKDAIAEKAEKRAEKREAKRREKKAARAKPAPQPKKELQLPDRSEPKPQQPIRNDKHSTMAEYKKAIAERAAADATTAPERQPRKKAKQHDDHDDR